jgi:hypothetical protein
MKLAASVSPDWGRFFWKSEYGRATFRSSRNSTDGQGMAKSSKLVAAKRGRVLLVRRKHDRLWMFPGGRKRARESDKDCLRREIKEELPKLKLGRLRLWKEVNAKNRHSGRRAQCHQE